MNILDENWDALAETLRKEIEGYGRLFGLLEEQRENLLKNNVEGLVSINDSMSAQAQFLQGLRGEREHLVSGIWKEAGQPGERATVKALLAHSPGNSSPLFEELLTEVNRLVSQSRRKLQHNQMLLHRSRDIGQRFLLLLNPEAAQTTVYARNGKSRSPVARGTSYSRYRSHA